MFCENCGEQLPEGATICARCGSVQHFGPSGSIPNSAPAPRGSSATAKLPLKLILVTVTASVLLVALIIAAIATKGFGAFEKPKNPIAATYDGLKSLFEMKSFGFEGEVSVDSYDFDFVGYLVSGETLEDSIISVDLSRTGRGDSEEAKAGIYDGYIFEVDDYGTRIEEFDEEFDMDEFDFEEAFDNGKLNWDSMVSELKNSMLDELDEAGIDADMEHVDAIWDALEGFIYDELSDETVMESVFKSSEITKLDGITTYKSKVELQRLVKALYSYLNDVIETDEKLAELVDEINDESEYGTVKEALKSGRDSLLQTISYSDIDEVEIAVGLDGKGNLRALQFGLENDDDEFEFKINLDEINKVVPDIEELDKIIEDAE